MTEKVKKKNVQKSSRKVQSSNTRNRKSVKRPSVAKVEAVAKLDEMNNSSDEKEVAAKVKPESKAKMGSANKVELEIESSAEAEINKKAISEERTDSEQKEDLKVIFINDDVEKRPLGKKENLDDEINKAKKIQRFAQEETILLSDIVEKITEEKVPANEVTKIRHEGARNIDGIMMRPRPMREQVSTEILNEPETTAEKAVKNSRAKKAQSKRRKTYRVNFGFKRILLALACASAAVFAIVYFVNLNAPNISLKVAAMQSGINASYPNYIPRDYYLSDITSESGKVTMNFKNPNTEESYSIVEEASSWDSTALLNNYVKSEYGSDYTTLKEQGLTVYMTSRAACWTNGGVVFKLKVTSGSLTKKQIVTIATSL